MFYHVFVLFVWDGLPTLRFVQLFTWTRTLVVYFPGYFVWKPLSFLFAIYLYRDIVGLDQGSNKPFNHKHAPVTLYPYENIWALSFEMDFC